MSADAGLLAEAADVRARFRAGFDAVVIGQRSLGDLVLTAAAAGGHVLLEGLPGTAKTRAARAAAGLLGLDFKRISFTPDLLPGDLTGAVIWNPQSGAFTVRRGPVFTEFLLADEINRAPAKVQSALLEAMQERRVTLGDDTHDLGPRFLTVATQNPVEQEGTHPLPEAQLDRFLFRLAVGPADADAELRVLRTVEEETALPPSIFPDREGLLRLRALGRTLHVDERLLGYLVKLARVTRGQEGPSLPLRFGVSTRGVLALRDAARLHAALDGRGYVHLDDLRDLLPAAWGHRLGLTYEALAEGRGPADLLEELLRAVPAP